MTARDTARLLPQALLMAVAAAMAAMALRFPRDAGEYAGPGAFPLALCAALAVLAAARAGQKVAARGRGVSTAAGADPGPPGPSETTGTKEGVAGAWRLPLLCVAYMILLPWLGFVSSTALFTAAVLGALGARRAGRVLAFGLALAIVLYVAFAVWMQVPLPEGWIG